MVDAKSSKTKSSVPVTPLLASTIVILLLVLFMSQKARAEPNSPDEIGFTSISSTALCRFGVNALTNSDAATAHLTGLKTGWYVDYRSTENPAHTNGISYVPIIDLNQIGDCPNNCSYDYRPKGIQLDAVIANNPGSKWIIGNEPDRRIAQNDMEPESYAAAYHEIYKYIKERDSSAEILAGAIVQPTPLRLKYLDLVLESYMDQFTVPMPVDGWAIHNFILNEYRDDDPSNIFGCDSTNKWGAGIPPGDYFDDNNICSGEEITYKDRLKHADDSLFADRLILFRNWMADNGFRELPLYVSEYGILLPEEDGFRDELMKDFMNKTFDFMIGATDPLLGNPNDGNRLVQNWSWFSTRDTNFNGNLFDPDKPEMPMTPIGVNYAEYTALIQPKNDIYVALYTDPSPVLSTVPLDVNVYARIDQVGVFEGAAGVSDINFYDRHPNAEDVKKIGSTQSVELTCDNDSQVASVLLQDLMPGHTYEIYAVVDQVNGETNIQNNTGSIKVLVASEALQLPIIVGN